jgi:hypothetical protein
MSGGAGVSLAPTHSGPAFFRSAEIVKIAGGTEGNDFQSDAENIAGGAPEPRKACISY